jgi:hypothetical protein
MDFNPFACWTLAVVMSLPLRYRTKARLYDLRIRCIVRSEPMTVGLHVIAYADGSIVFFHVDGLRVLTNSEIGQITKPRKLAHDVVRILKWQPSSQGLLINDAFFFQKLAS